MEHYIERCRSCHVVTSQCRCPSTTKDQLWTICIACTEKGLPYTKVWVLLHTTGYSHSDVSVVSVHTTEKSAITAHKNHSEQGNCIVEESKLYGEL